MGCSSRSRINNSIVFRPDNPLVADVRVRQALLAATNRPEIVSTLFSKNYPVATSIIASTAIGYVDQSAKLGFDVEKAKALLGDAGFKPGADDHRRAKASQGRALRRSLACERL